MTTELVIITLIGAFIMIGAFLGENGPRTTFAKSAPHLGARIEKHLETGSGFIDNAKQFSWTDK